MVRVVEGAGGGQEGGPVIRRVVRVKGIVQGVGFRPFVYNLAVQHGLVGWVLNSAKGVTIDIEGPRAEVESFLAELTARPPRLARITSIETEEAVPVGFEAFIIRSSEGHEEKEALISPDVALCPDCRREVFDPADRRYRYPFTNCTNCGPRFTIIEDIPYDRDKTTMRAFPMCPECEAEYHDPSNRRFHAQPNACPRCGPRVSLVDRDGRVIAGNDWAGEFRRLIRAGHIIAVKGLGGFHLACDAANGDAVAELRRRKARPAKPFAVMCRDIEAVRRYCRVSPAEEVALTSTEAPIVVLERHPGCPLPEALAPGLVSLGVMLPYTPLHALLFGEGVDILVMTSGNVSDLPLVTDNGAARRELGAIADYFLEHDRDIRHRCDDSLVRVVDGDVHLYRRSRGYVPRHLDIPGQVEDLPALGAGAEMKNSFCLIKGGRAFFGPHIGEMEFVETLEVYRKALADFQRLVNIEPQVLGYDLHPAYQVSGLARALPAIRRVGVQHHHAHMAACMAENGLERPCIGVVLDGTGYGTDGNLWGFEVLAGDYRDFERLWHLAYIPLPGGEQAIRHPLRVAAAYLDRYLGTAGLDLARRLHPGRETEMDLAARLAVTGLNSPPACGCGRLFDAVSALSGICLDSTYEGQAAVQLAELVSGDAGEEEYPFSLSKGEIDPGPLWENLGRDLAANVARPLIATRFHNTVVSMVLAAVRDAHRQTGLVDVALSGGTFQNPYLTSRIHAGLARYGLRPHIHRQVPANDGGLALGQAIIARRRCQ